jgi:hypothetical protein
MYTFISLQISMYVRPYVYLFTEMQIYVFLYSMCLPIYIYIYIYILWCVILYMQVHIFYIYLPPQIQRTLLRSSISSDRKIFLSTSTEPKTSGISDSLYLLCWCHIWSLSVFIHSIPPLTFPLPPFSPLTFIL